MVNLALCLPLTLAVIVIGGMVFQPCAFIAFISILHLVSFVCMVLFSKIVMCEGEIYDLYG